MEEKTKFYQKTYFNNVFILGVLVLTVSFFIIMADGFWSYMNMLNVFREVVFVVVTGAAATFLLVAGYVDLSVGSILALSCVTFALACSKGIPIILSLIIAMGAGAIIGLINGFIIVKLKIPPVITTLGTLYFARGMTFVVSGISPIRGALPGFTFLGRGTIGPVPFQLIIIIIVIGLFYFMERKSLLFKYAVAVGGNKVAASLSGINVDRLVTTLYIITGAMAGLSGAIMASKLSVGEQLVGYGFEFDVIVAMLLGGASFTGGEGSVLGLVIGAFIVSVLGIGFNMIGIPSFYQFIVKGIVLVLAVAFDSFIKKKMIREL